MNRKAMVLDIGVKPAGRYCFGRRRGFAREPAKNLIALPRPLRRRMVSLKGKVVYDQRILQLYVSPAGTSQDGPVHFK